MNGSFGDNLKKARKRSGLVQKQLAELAGIGQAAVANYEKGIRFPGEETLRTLSGVLGVSLDELMSTSPKKGGGARKGSAGDFSQEEFMGLLLTSSRDAGWKYLQSRFPDISDSSERLFQEVFIPVLERTGDLWARGELSAAEEHILTAKVRELIILSSSGDSKGSVHPPMLRGTWLGFAAPGDEHDMGLLMLSRVMAERNWHSVFLGLAPPLADLKEAVSRYRPDVVAASVISPSLWNGLEAYLRGIKTVLPKGSLMIVGGRGSENHLEAAQSIGVHIVGSLDEAAALAEHAIMNIQGVKG